MFYILLFCFFSSAFLVFYTYVAFPWLMKLMSKKSMVNALIWTEQDELPRVSVIIAAYNEERVMEDKLNSLLKSDYPIDKVEILIGSDASDDNTAAIVKKFSKQSMSVQLYEFKERRGKPSVINDLVRFAANEILILTDANVLFEPATIRHLVAHFKNKEIGLVGANILNVGQMNDGISHQETSYIARENRIKYYEGIKWGVMMGPFGGCFALRKELFIPVPENFLVDDFYICMQILKKGYKCLNELNAVCYEDVSNDISQEYRRKARISAGNFQNLSTFSSVLLKPFSPLGFCFISHKVLRWLTPFLLIISLLSLAFLGSYHRVFYVLCLGQFILLLSPLADALLRSLGLHWKLLRFVSYFSYMNLALLVGFIRFVTGIRRGVWTPTRRITS